MDFNLGTNQKEKTLLARFVQNMDWLLLAAVFFLVMTGLIAIYSATLHYGNAGKFFMTQIIAFLVGLFGLLIMLSWNYQTFRDLTYFLYIFSSALLFLVLLFGSTIRGTKGWFNLGYFAFQPVEICKILFILVLSGYLDKHWRDIKRWQQLLAPLLLLFGQIFLILLQPDFSSTLVYFPVTLILLYVAGAEPLYLIAMVLFGSISVGIPLLSTFFRLQPAFLNMHPVFNYFVSATKGGMPAFIVLSSILIILFILWWLINNFRIRVNLAYYIIISAIIVAGSMSSYVVQKSIKEYQRKRLVVFLNPDIDPLGSGYNIIQSKIAIGSGKLLGRGLFQGTQSQLGFLPEQHTDFIFSVIGEETGFIFTLLTLTVYFLLVWRALLVAREAHDRFGSLVATGIATMFAFYSIINIGMVMGLMPATGLPLPLLSYGGSSLVSSLLALGILFSIHIRRFTH